MTSAPPGATLSAVGGIAFAASGHTGSHDALLLGLCVSASVLLVVASTAVAVVLRALAALARQRRTLYGVRNLTPEKIIGYEDPARAEETPGLMSRRIVERSEEIRRRLRSEPSEVEIAMCVMGYYACADDLLALIELAGERFPKAGPIRRLTMLAAVRRATDCLAHTRRDLRPYARAGPPSGPPTGAAQNDAG